MGHEGMRASLVSPRGHRRLGRDRHARRALRRLRRLAGCDKSMPGDADGRGPPRPAARVRLRRLDPARPSYNGPRRRHHRACSRRSARCAAGTISREELDAIERAACPGEGACGGMFTANTMARSAEAIGMSAARHRRRPPAVDRRRDGYARARRRGGGRPASARHHAARDHDQGGVRERHRRRDGARRLDERRAAPAGHRQRGRRRARPRRLQPHRRPRAAHRRHEAGRQVPHDRPRPRRRRARSCCSTCSTPACCTATA